VIEMGNKEIVSEGSKYILNTYKRAEVAFVSGKGARVWDADGKEYVDFLAGIAVSSLGYNNSKLNETINDQSEKILHSSNLFWIEPQIKLAKMICENSFGDKVFFCNSGTEANEAAIKIARKYGLSKYGAERFEIVSMVNSFHGRTLGALAATGQEKYHKSFLPMVPGFRFAKFNDIDDLTAKIDEKVCAVILEPVQGEGGIAPVNKEYIKKVRDICNERDIILIFDEVQCGVGRTGTLFAYEQLGVAPDIMTLAKGLAGGVPIGAVVVGEKHNNVFVPGDHGCTFGGNHLACASGCTVLEELKSGVLQNVGAVSEYLVNKLNMLKEETNFIEFIKGMGLMIGVKLTFDSSKVPEECLKKGLIINSLGNNMLRIVPPLVISQKDVDDGIIILKSVLEELSIQV
jgi:predicted acetylornithine/succinylornithine family transaminase